MEENFESSLMHSIEAHTERQGGPCPSNSQAEENSAITTEEDTNLFIKPFKKRRSSHRYLTGPVNKSNRRVVMKNGDCNIFPSHIPRHSHRYLQDTFTTLVDARWRWTLCCFALSFLISWFIFAILWWTIALAHGDLELQYKGNKSWTPCVTEMQTFTGCFLFSIEVQHTTGFGTKATTEECPEAIFMLIAQSIVGVIIEAIMAGIVFAKVSRPKHRNQTILFSKNAVVCQRNGELCLMFRIADMRKTHIIEAKIRAQLIKTTYTSEGEVIPYNHQELIIRAKKFLFIWPMTIVHKIDSSSPFYDMSAKDMLHDRYEIAVILEGVAESTGLTTQVRSSYIPKEIFWGHRFEPMISYSNENQGFQVNYSFLNSTIPVDTPLCSMRQLDNFYSSSYQDNRKKEKNCFKNSQ